MTSWLRKWAVNILTAGFGAFVFVEREWCSSHITTAAAREAARRASIAQPGAYCMVIRLGHVLVRYEDGEFLSHPSQVTSAQITRLIAGESLSTTQGVDHE